MTINSNTATLLEALEPRMLLSGSPITGVLASGSLSDTAYQDYLQSTGVIVATDLPAEAKTIYGVSDATPDDGLDDTAALQAAISWALGDGLDGNRNFNIDSSPPIIFLPDGVYNVSDTIQSKDLNGLSWSSGWRRGLQLVGESQAGTIIKLDDNATGFNSAAISPKAVLQTGSQKQGSGSTNPAGGGNQAFDHSIYNLTVDVGADNPNAIGIDYQVSNTGSVEDVTIKSSDPTGEGYAALSMERADNGPGLVKNVTTEGFDYGMKFNSPNFSVTVEHAYINDPNIAGIFNGDQTLAVRNLVYSGDVPAFDSNHERGSFTLIGADLTNTGTNSNQAAITNDGRMFARDVSSTGFDVVIDNISNDPKLTQEADVFAASGSGTTVVDQYSSHAIQTLFDSQIITLDLEIKETPEYHTDDLSKWINVEDFGATGHQPFGSYPTDPRLNDDAIGIQAAIEYAEINQINGAIIYLPVGDYHIEQTIVVDNDYVAKIMGMKSSITFKDDGDGAHEDLIRYEGTAGNQFIIEQFRFNNDEAWNQNASIVHAGAGTLAVRHTAHAGYYNTTAGTGDVFFEDTRGIPIDVAHGQNFYARQLNMEFRDQLLTVDNANAWILGFKTEGEMNTALHAKNGSKVEVFGGFHYNQGIDPSDPDPLPTDNPAYLIEDSQASLSFSIGNNDKYNTLVREVQGSVTRDVLRGTNQYLGQIGWWKMVPLFTSTGTGTTPAEYIIDNKNGHNDTGQAYSESSGWSGLGWTGPDSNWVYGEYTNASGFYDSNARHDNNSGKGTKSATFSQDFPASGTYTAYARWRAKSSHATNVPIDVVHAGGTTTVYVDQTKSDAQWVDLGTYDFGSDGQVVIRNDGTNGRVIADAVRFIEVPDSPLLSENFNDALLNGWGSSSNGSWSVVDGELEQSTNDTNAFLTWDESVAQSWTDYSYELTMRSTDNDFIGATFRYQDEDNYYRFVMYQQQNKRMIERVSNGVVTTIASTAGSYTIGQDYSISITAIGNQFTVSVDGADQFGTVTDSTHSSGTVGLYSYWNQSSYFDDILVEEI